MAKKEDLKDLFKELEQLEEEQEKTILSMGKQFEDLTRQALEEGVEDLALERQIEEKERLIQEQEQKMKDLRGKIVQELEKEYGGLRTVQEIARERTRLTKMAEKGKLSKEEMKVRTRLLTARMSEINSNSIKNIKTASGYIGAVFPPGKIEGIRQEILKRMSELRSELPQLKAEREHARKEIAKLSEKVRKGKATEEDKKRIAELKEKERTLTEKALDFVHTINVQEATLESLEKAREISRARVASQRKRDLEKLERGKKRRRRA